MRCGGIDNEALEFGPLEERDLEGISSLILGMGADSEEQRLRDKSPRYYRWMYQENPAGDAVVYLARAGSRVVASFAIAPRLFHIDGTRILVGKTMDMFTHPDHQGKGLIKRCTAAVFEGARSREMQGWYVTPSSASYPIFKKKWGYREGFSITFRSRVLQWSAVLGAVLPVGRGGRTIGRFLDSVGAVFRRDFRLPEGWRLENLQNPGEEVDHLWSRVASSHKIWQVRDASYLNWRYVSNPDHYTLLGLRWGEVLSGVIVLGESLRRGVKVGDIVDLVCHAQDQETFRLLIQAAVDHARRYGYELVQAWSIPGTRLDRQLKRAGLPIVRGNIRFLTSPGFPCEDAADPEAWFLTQGDGNDV